MARQVNEAPVLDLAVSADAVAWVRECTELVRELGACVHEPARLTHQLTGARAAVCVLCGARRVPGEADAWIDAEYTHRARVLLAKV